jgi:hypothetical protein
VANASVKLLAVSSIQNDSVLAQGPAGTSGAS